MAYAYQKKRDKAQAREKRRRPDPRWYIGFKDERGAHVQVATNARSKAEALRFAQELEHRAERVRAGLEAGAPLKTSFRELADRYEREIAAMKRGYAIVKYRLRALVKFFGDKPITAIGPAEAQEFIGSMARDGYAPNTITAQYALLRAMFAVAIRWRLLHENPMRDVERPEIPEKEPRYLELHEIGALLRKTPEEFRGVVATALLGGLRTGEVAGLTPESFDPAARTLRVSRSWNAPTTKSGKTRVVPVSGELLPYLQAALEKNAKADRLFMHPAGRPLQKWDGLATKVRGWAKDAGIPVRADQPLQFRHLRSTFATHAAEQVDLRFVQKALGHSAIEITEKSYAGVRGGHLAAEAKRLRLATDPTRTEDVSATPKKGRKDE